MCGTMHSSPPDGQMRSLNPTAARSRPAPRVTRGTAAPTTPAAISGRTTRNFSANQHSYRQYPVIRGRWIEYAYLDMGASRHSSGIARRMALGARAAPHQDGRHGSRTVRPRTRRALAVISENMPPSLTADMIPLLRQGVSPAEDLTLGGIVTLTDTDLGDGVSVVVCRPVAAPTPAPVVYWIHGGGMILGDHRVRAGRSAGLGGGARARGRVGRLPAGPRAPRSHAGRGLLPRADLGREERRRSGDRPRQDHRGGRQRRGRAGGGDRAAGPGPGRARGVRPAAGVPDARRPQRHLLRPPDVRARDMGPHVQRDRLDRPARRRAGRARRVDLRLPGARHRPVRAAAGLHRRRLGRDLPRRGRGLRHGHLAVGRSGRTPRVAGRVPRLRRDGPAGGAVAAAPSRPASTG